MIKMIWWCKTISHLISKLIKPLAKIVKKITRMETTITIIFIRHQLWMWILLFQEVQSLRAGVNPAINIQERRDLAILLFFIRKEADPPMLSLLLDLPMKNLLSVMLILWIIIIMVFLEDIQLKARKRVLILLTYHLLIRNTTTLAQDIWIIKIPVLIIDQGALLQDVSFFRNC